MNRTTPYGSRYTGIFRDDVTPALKIYNRGTLVQTIDGANSVLAGTMAPPSVTTITGDTSAYVEGTIVGVIDALEAFGMVVDSHTT
jgi:hypothetical protein